MSDTTADRLTILYGVSNLGVSTGLHAAPAQSIIIVFLHSRRSESKWTESGLPLLSRRHEVLARKYQKGMVVHEVL
ncbi:hypothetical protein LY76DRAFT_595646 [Colletotrichum caudatum]|nr:hypothetical protein LY76DRAFT_595646 [Colletotrichum caudatum]